MATFRKVSRLVPSSQRHAVITEVDTGDEINFVEILGRPARRIKMVLPANITSMDVRLNNRIRIEPDTRQIGIGEHSYDPPPTVFVVSEGEQHPVYSLAGNAEYYTEEGMSIAFLQVADVTVGSGSSNVSIYCW